MRTVSVAIVGAGTAGLTALGVVRKSTDDFVIINDGPYGTTCSRVGCMPSKALIQIANDLHRCLGLDEVGIRGAGAANIDLPAALAWVRNFRDGRVGHTLKATEQVGERNIPGRARLVAPDELLVARADGGEERIRARAIVLATGSRPIVPPAWSAFGERLLTTDTLFERRDLPRRIAVIGLGAIGLELGQALARLGLEITAFELRQAVAYLTDPDLNAYALERFSSEFPVHLGHAVEINDEGGPLHVSAGAEEATVDAVLAAMGRTPNVAGLGLERLGVALDGRGLPPFDRHTMQIADLPVFIAGDLSADRVVMHEASDEGFIAAWNALHGPVRYRRRSPLAIAFTDPEIALVGDPVAAARAPDTVSASYDFSRQGRALAMRRASGLVKLYASRGDGRLLGAEMMAPHAEHMAHLLALALEQRLSVADLLRLPVYHPVLEEGLRSALRTLAKRAYGEAPLEFRTLAGAAR